MSFISPPRPDHSLPPLAPANAAPDAKAYFGKESSNLSGEEAWKKNLRGDTAWLGPRPPCYYSGKPPVFGECPGVGADGTITSLPLPVRAWPRTLRVPNRLCFSAC